MAHSTLPHLSSTLLSQKDVSDHPSGLYPCCGTVSPIQMLEADCPCSNAESGPNEKRLGHEDQVFMNGERDGLNMLRPWEAAPLQGMALLQFVCHCVGGL